MVFTIFLIFTGAAVLSTLVLATRQSLLVAYILLGAVVGPWGLQWVPDASVVQQIGEVGIIFLLFLLGLNLTPQNLIHMLRKVIVVAMVSSIVFIVMTMIVLRSFGFVWGECLIIGAAMMFSSTIIGLKLLPTTILHHQHIGEIMIGILLLQDLIAIVVLLLVHGAGIGGGLSLRDIALVVVTLPLLFIFAFLMEKYVLVKLLAKFDRTQEYIFLLSIGWCLGLAQLAQVLGLSLEIGAFIAGVALAASPISLYIADSLRPLRDFFLVLFFFSVGASFDFDYLTVVLWPALSLAALILIVKPIVFYFLLRNAGEEKHIAKEVGVRLGQASEFSLLIASLVVGTGLISDIGIYLLQATTIITFIVSSYWVVLKYPTPIALSDKMRRD